MEKHKRLIRTIAPLNLFFSQKIMNINNIGKTKLKKLNVSCSWIMQSMRSMLPSR